MGLTLFPDIDVSVRVCVWWGAGLWRHTEQYLQRPFPWQSLRDIQIHSRQGNWA